MTQTPPTKTINLDILSKTPRYIRALAHDLEDLDEKTPDHIIEQFIRQRLKRNPFTWPKERASQLLHPIELRDTFGMKYCHVSQIVHFARVPSTGQPLAVSARQALVWLHRPEMCAPIVDLLKRGHPLLLIDDRLVYGASLRRAIALHLLSLFSTQIEIQPEREDGIYTLRQMQNRFASELSFLNCTKHGESSSRYY